MEAAGAPVAHSRQLRMAIDAHDHEHAPLRFWRWWTSELAGLASILSPSRLGFSAAGLAIAQGADGSWIATSKSGRDVAFLLDEAADAARPQTASLRLAATDCFVRRLTLPKVGPSEVARLLALDLERSTPFKSVDTYSGHVVLPERARPGFAHVMQVIVPRQAVDIKLKDLQARGLRVTHIDCSSADPALVPLNLLAADRSKPRSKTWRWLIPASVLLTGSAITIDSAKHQAAITSLAAQTGEALAGLKAQRQSSQSAAAAQAQTGAVRRLYQTRVSTRIILDELARLLPDSVWLTEVKIESGVVDISGLAKSAATLVGLFESTDLFTGAELTSAITRVEDLDRERFSLRTRVTSKERVRGAAPEPGQTQP